MGRSDGRPRGVKVDIVDVTQYESAALAYVREQLGLEHVDVVEVDQDVIDLVGPHYDDPRVKFWPADAFAMEWPTGTRWDVVWHDVWDDISADNLPGMITLHRKYGRRVRWQGSWCRDLCEKQRRQDSAWW